MCVNRQYGDVFREYFILDIRVGNNESSSEHLVSNRSSLLFFSHPILHEDDNENLQKEVILFGG